MKIKNNSISNTKIAIIFFVFLIFFIVISLLFKVIAIVRAGQFDDSKRFTLTITNGRNIEAVSINPSSKNIAVFKLDDGISSSEAGRILEIPIDGYINLSSLDLGQKIDALFFKTIFSFGKSKTNLTIIDLLKLTMITRSVPESSVDTIMVKDSQGLDKIVGNLAVDSFIEKDNQTIQIINGTDVGGLGNRLARFITNMGGNVIMVATSDSTKKRSSISYIDKKTYTVEKLQKILGYEIVKDAENKISDITIIIGEDKVDSNPF